MSRRIVSSSVRAQQSQHIQHCSQCNGTASASEPAQLMLAAKSHFIASAPSIDLHRASAAQLADSPLRCKHASSTICQRSSGTASTRIVKSAPKARDHSQRIRAQAVSSGNCSEFLFAIDEPKSHRLPLFNPRASATAPTSKSRVAARFDSRLRLQTWQRYCGKNRIERNPAITATTTAHREKRA